AELPMCWICPAHPAPVPDADGALPLAAFESPFLFRGCATHALDRAGIAWLAAFTSPSLAGLWAAVAAGLDVAVRTPLRLPPPFPGPSRAGLWAAVAVGLGVAVRTPLGLQTTVRELIPGEHGLTEWPVIALSLYRAHAKPDPVCAAQDEILVQCVNDSVAASA